MLFYSRLIRRLKFKKWRKTKYLLWPEKFSFKPVYSYPVCACSRPKTISGQNTNKSKTCNSYSNTFVHDAVLCRQLIRCFVFEIKRRFFFRIRDKKTVIKATFQVLCRLFQISKKKSKSAKLKKRINKLQIEKTTQNTTQENI